ncbi:eCIS core domain-containing protein [Anthocerotibacter panamensis]|uniref:eCIS core domain-containing protein n=1 Tax=Anthocerotibacter panamensis TaxID=2857077 RepID=UPI001C4068D7|nr:DUF4157 domain-containing protein [Anthocerotibacter panamensis]
MEFTRVQRALAQADLIQTKKKPSLTPSMQAQSALPEAEQAILPYTPLPADFLTNHPLKPGEPVSGEHRLSPIQIPSVSAEAQRQMSATEMPVYRSLTDDWRTNNPFKSVPGEPVSGQRRLSPIQTKLTVGQPGDAYEQEADRVAAQVVSQINAPQPSQQVQREELPEEELQMKPMAGIIQREELPEEELQMKPMAGIIQREELPEEELQMKPMAGIIQREELPEEELQMKPMAGIIQREELPEEELQMKPMLQRQGEQATAPADVEGMIQQARGGGQGIADTVRGPLEQAFGADFSGVRVHTDSQSDSLNQSLQARAFTTGQDIFFRQGEYNPGNTGGQELLAHELTHVIQQTGRVQRQIYPQSAPTNTESLIQRDVDRRTDRRTDRRIERDRRERRPSGGRGSSGGSHLDYDWAGRAILERYLTGGGDWTIVNDSRWSDYMKANALLTTQLRQRMLDKVRFVAAASGTYIPINDTFPMAIENGEGIVGYQYLHGTNASVGDFNIQGHARIDRDQHGNKTIRFTTAYTWNDIIDPNPQYATDQWKSQIAEVITLGHAQAYNIHLRWIENCTVRLDASGAIVQTEGWPLR